MGTVVLSVDAELAWGFHDMESPPEDRIAVSRDAWNWLLTELEYWNIPATWAVVGHLFLNECRAEHNLRTAPNNWFMNDPGGTWQENSLWYAPDLIEAIQESKVDHEIGCHSFSHIPLNHPDITADMFADELATWCEIADTWNISPSSFVYPRNVIGFRPLLASYGFKGYRGRTPLPWWLNGTLQPVTKVASLYRSGAAAPVVKPSVDRYGLVNVPASLYLFGFEGPFATAVEQLTADPIVCAAKRGIEEVAAGTGVFHLWMHPNNLISVRERNRLRTIFAHLDSVRNDDDINIAPMKEVISQYGET